MRPRAPAATRAGSRFEPRTRFLLCARPPRRLEGKAIALRWKPTAFVPVKFRVGAARSMIALPGASRAEPVLMVPNVLELLQDMLDLGEGLLTVAEPVR